MKIKIDLIHVNLKTHKKMAAKFETGHAKNVANFKKLMSACTEFGTTYNPSNSLLTMTSLKTIHAQSKVSLNKVSKTKSVHDDFEGERGRLFKNYKPLATQIMGAVKSSGAPQSVIDDAMTINRKMQGRRAPRTKATTNPDGTPINRNSVSQQSFDMRIEHLDRMIELLDVEPKYNPNEVQLSVEGLRGYHDELETINEKVIETYGYYNTAMTERNRKLYIPETGLIAIAQSVKNYVKSIYKTNTPEYKTISKLAFKILVEIK